MNIIGSLLAREFLSFNDKLNIIFLPADNPNFVMFIDKLNHKILEIKDLYYGSFIPNILLCNNKIFQYQQALDLSIRYHIPILIIDHHKKNPMLDEKKIQVIDDLPSSYSIALNNDIYVSWDKIHNQVLDFNINDNDSLEIWNNLLHNIAKKVYTI